MRHLTSKLILALVCSLQLSTSLADSQLWQDIQTKQAKTTDTTPQQRLLSLDETSLAYLLNSANTAPELDLPLPTGGFARVRLLAEEMLAPEIAAQHPHLKTWRVEGISNNVVSGRADMTLLGFHAMLVMKNGDTLYIDPTQPSTQASERTYRSLSKRANALLFQSNFSCGTQAPLRHSFSQTSSLAARTLANKWGESLHTYDLAIAATSSYTQYFGSKEAAFSAITSMVNRINEIYERDLSIKLRLVSNTNTLFSSKAQDPFIDYTPDRPALILDRNQTVLDTLVGKNNYDIGHLLTISDGGVALVESVCSDEKAKGLSGIDKPTGDTFAIDFVAHELGHQFGATHTFNSVTGSCSGSRTVETAYEPGSGSSIMAYAGLCTGNNLQTSSDAMFHSGSIAQITQFAHSGKGANCATVSKLNNKNPVVDAGKDYNIPARTPFMLNGSASDTDNDSLSYVWEQMDTGTASKVDVDTGTNALIRSVLPSDSSTRLIPRFSSLTSNSHIVGEALPITTRTLSFRLQARDGKGGIGHDDMRLNVTDTGKAFAVTAPHRKKLTANETLTVKWEVADTDKAPINCTTVEIALNKNDTEAGFQTLLDSTKNDGAAQVTLPASLGNKNRIRVKCKDNVFFALSDSAPRLAKTASEAGNDVDVIDVINVIEENLNSGSGSLPIELLLGIGWVWFIQKRARSSQA